jgi:hypothetical protein
VDPLDERSDDRARLFALDIVVLMQRRGELLGTFAKDMGHVRM